MSAKIHDGLTRSQRSRAKHSSTERYRKNHAEMNRRWLSVPGNRAKQYASNREWRRRNKARVQALSVAYWARKREAAVCDQAIDATYHLLTSGKRLKCYYCRKRIKGGKHNPANIALAHAVCNLRKGSKLPDEIVVSGQPLLRL